MAFHYVEPEVAGDLGPSSVIDPSVHPPVVSRLEYRFSDWLGDDLVESFPCFVVTESLAARLSGLTGFTLDEVTATVSEEGADLLDRPLPAWRWLKIVGDRATDDFALSADFRLVVSDRALDVLRSGSLANAVVEPAS